MTHLEISDKIMEIEIIAERLTVISQDIREDYFGKSKIETSVDKWVLYNSYHHNSVKADMVLNFALDIAEKLTELGKCIDDTVPEYIV